MRVRYKYNEYEVIQIKFDNYYTITIKNVDTNNIVLLTHSRRLLEKDECINYIRNIISKLYKQDKLLA